MKCQDEYFIPDVFKTMELPYPDTREGKATACADGLCAWGLTMCGATVPNFGETLVLIGRFVGCSPTHQGLEQAAIDLGFLDPWVPGTHPLYDERN